MSTRAFVLLPALTMFVGLALFFASIVAGDRPRSAQAASRPNPYEITPGYETVPWSDPETGCRYLATRVKAGYALTPRLKPGGRDPDCREPAAK